jgi:hypothetical protein
MPFTLEGMGEGFVDLPSLVDLVPVPGVPGVPGMVELW